MNKQSGRIGLYLVLIVMLVAGYFYLNNQVASQSSYSMESMKQAAEDGKLSSAKIYQNREVPTGSVVADIEGEGKKKVYVTDVKDAQKLLEGYGIHPEVADVPQESVFMTTFFPVLLTGGLVIFLFLMMNRQMSGGGGNAKMMNFGKSRARMMLPDDKKVTFQNVAGLQEEKEDLVEVVDFLKAPQKYTNVGARIPKGVILVGPPGTGKTSIAHVIAMTSKSEFKKLNAVSSGKKDMEEIVSDAERTFAMYGRKTILFVDEIHRFNKGQQDFLLPYVENGTIILIGATTENPYFEVNGALISRSLLFEMKPLNAEDIKELLLRAISDKKKGLGDFDVHIDDDALGFLSEYSNGDARVALNAIELAVLTTKPARDGSVHVDLDVVEDCIQKRPLNYDKDGDNHYDTISAFIKSMRGSDPDAAVYYLAKMLYAGEDIKFIARRIMICASEDVGNADPMALTVAVSASQAVERIGMPEAQIILSQAVTYVATAPKSNASYIAIADAMASVKRTKTTVPSHLQDAHYKGAQKLGHGTGYKYAHDYPHHYVEQQYLPDEIAGEKFYVPCENGHERKIKEWMQYIRQNQ